MNRRAVAQVHLDASVPVPAQVAPYVRAIGVEKTVEFFLSLGGTEIYLAENPRPDSMVAKLVGLDGVKALGRELGFGHHFRVPLSKPWLAAHLKSEGWTVTGIARLLHVSDTTVRGWLKSRHDDRQISLF